MVTAFIPAMAKVQVNYLGYGRVNARSSDATFKNTFGSPLFPALASTTTHFFPAILDWVKRPRKPQQRGRGPRWWLVDARTGRLVPFSNTFCKVFNRPEAKSYEREGLTEFAVSGEPRSFKYALSVVDTCLRISIEDTVTREQWRTEPLTVADFTTFNSTIPQAEAEVYAEHIAECFEPTAASPKTTRWLSNIVGCDQSRELSVGFELQALTFSTLLEYSFTLNAVDLSPMELLTSRVRDLETMMLELRHENRLLQAEVDAVAKHQRTTQFQFQLMQDGFIRFIQRLRQWFSAVDYAQLWRDVRDKTVACGRGMCSSFPSTADFGVLVVRLLYLIMAVLRGCLVVLKFLGLNAFRLLCGGGGAEVKPRGATKLR